MSAWRKILHFIYVKVLKPIFFLLSPDAIHNYVVSVIELVQRFPLLVWIAKVAMGPRRPSPVVGPGGVELKSIVGLSAGFDKNGQTVPLMSALGCGFVTIGSITLEPRSGNVRPWFYRLPKTKSLVVHAGLANVGVESVVGNLKRTKAHKADTKIIASVALVASNSEQSVADIVEDAMKCADRLVQSGLVHAIEFNVSCPNVKDDKLFSVDDNFKALLSEVDRRGFDLPLLVKMPLLHDLSHFDRLVKIASTTKIDGLTIANLEKDRKKAEELVQDKLPSTVKGGISGSVTKTHNLQTIKRVRKNYGDRFFIIGVGGIFGVSDAQDYIRSGADAVALITGIIFEGPQIIGAIADEVN